ncbi:MAG: redox-sensing transcriptional repressor Rex [Dehalococcoidia bacterium]|nr:MAG: redox-sensing transcriptional repressor Rex [bacterium]MCE7928739.1 redox-sensing transcriptional repressor Rex [Chloroflexi bacterium CFX7]MCK6565156.1 redox-sensing transcriptional repressor Rex [Dehalococcoidia bacterium]MCL4230217.1 redox-sensing transcriptional repressor Rex [Dehalococcoidia bacterium]NUQ56305.1 redox-sensing transcriptional repressor Rex [Dehalococcoidia bacterium]
MALEIPEVVINRLPIYARALAALAEQGETVVSSQALGQALDVTPAQIRKDLSYFGRFGKQGRGYNVPGLRAKLREILGLDRQWRVCVVGVGRLGQAIVEYGGFGPQGFQIVAAFDADPAMVGRKVGGVTVRAASGLDEFLRESHVDIGVVAVPAAVAQQVVDQLVEAGIRAILNYAPMTPHVPADVSIRHIDPVIAMQSMTFYIKLAESSAK